MQTIPIVQIVREFEGQCGRKQTPVFIVFVGGKEVGFSKRRWLAQAIGNAVQSGAIPATGDTTAALVKWAHANDGALYDRILSIEE